jgi:hypothetical protein
LCLNAHEWAKQQAGRQGFGFKPGQRLPLVYWWRIPQLFLLRRRSTRHSGRRSSQLGETSSTSFDLGDGKALFMTVAEWRGTENMDELLHSRTGQLMTGPARAPGVGWP